MRGIQVIIVQFPNQVLELLRVLVQMYVSHLLLAQNGCDSLRLCLSLLGHFILLLVQLRLVLIESILLQHLANLILQSILLFDHLPLE